MTKSYKRKHRLLSILSLILTLAPILVFTVLAFINGEIHQKLTLGCTLIIAIILVALNVIMKYHIRSTLWIVVLGIYTCMDNIMPLLLTIAICTIVDEFIVHPLSKKYKNLYIINKEIDKRG